MEWATFTAERREPPLEEASNPVGSSSAQLTGDNWGSQVGQNFGTINNSFFTTQPSGQPPADACQEALEFPRMQFRFKDINSATDGTCRWLFDHAQYQAWVASDRSILWINGKAGSGKSTLIKFACENTDVVPGLLDPDGQNIVLKFFFHGRGSQLQHDLCGFWRAILHDLLEAAPEPLAELAREYGPTLKHIRGQRYGDEWEWHKEDLRKFFESALLLILQSRRVLIYVDALDECVNERGAYDTVPLVRHFHTLVRNAESPGLRRFNICCSRRHYPVLPLECDYEIETAKENTEDISTHVAHELSQLIGDQARLQHLSIASLITTRASGVFMWACLVVDKVLAIDIEGGGPAKIKEAIDHMPGDLDALYTSLLKEMKAKVTRQDSLRLIQWLCFAAKPLGVEELPWAMVVDPDGAHTSLDACRKSEHPEFITQGRIERSVRALSCGLAEIVPAWESWPQQESGSPSSSTSSLDAFSSARTGRSPPSPTHIVQFIHQTAKDFFIRKGLATLDNESVEPTDIATMVGTVHLRLAKICLRYLALVQDNVEQDRDDSSNIYSSSLAFEYYAESSWRVHSQQSASRNIPQDDLLAILSWAFEFDTEEGRWMPGARARQRGILFHGGGSGPTLSQYAARYGLAGLLRSVLSNVAPYDVAGSRNELEARDVLDRTPFATAVAFGKQDVVKLLLDSARVDVNSANDKGWSPLLVAIQKNNLSIVRLLLESTASQGTSDCDRVYQPGLDRQDPLALAVSLNHVAIVKLLLDSGSMIVNFKDFAGQKETSPIFWAVSNNNVETMKLLLDTGRAKLNIRNDCGHTPFSAAVRSRNKAMVKFLLETGQVDVNRLDNGRTPLSLAVASGDIELVRLLLQSGQVDTTIRSEDCPSLCWYAVLNGNEALVNLLLEHGATSKQDAEWAKTELSEIRLRWG